MQEKSSRRFWVLFVLGFFAIDLTIAVIAISMAAGDPSFRSIPGFGERSVHWDERQQKQKLLEELGWSIELDSAQSTKEELRLRVLDRNGKYVEGVQLQIGLFHYTRVAEQQKILCVEKDGYYIADAKLHKPGLWNMDIDGDTADGRKIWSQQTIRWEMTP
jgi:nitrogen fixation protein FixH